MTIRSTINERADQVIFRRVAGATTVRNRLLRRVEGAMARGDQRTADRSAHRYRVSPDVALFAANEARKRLAARSRAKAVRLGQYRPGQYHGPTLQETVRVAEAVNLSEQTSELVTTFDQVKANGGRRRLSCFSQQHLTRQIILNDVNCVRKNLHAGQMATTNGLAAAHQAVTDVLRDTGVKFVVLSDIQAFYDNIDPAALGALLRVPQAVIDANVSYDHMNLRHVERETRLLGDVATPSISAEPEVAIRGLAPIELARSARAYTNDGEEIDAPVNRTSLVHMRFNNRRGIPQGAVSSAMIGEYVVAEVLHRRPAHLRSMSWSDNITEFCASRAQAMEAANTLRSELSEAPTGPFTLKDVSIRRVCDGFEYLGARFRRRNGRITCKPSPTNLRIFWQSVSQWEKLIFQTGTGQAEARRYVTGWGNVFSACPAAEYTALVALGRLIHAARLRCELLEGRSDCEVQATIAVHYLGGELGDPADLYSRHTPINGGSNLPSVSTRPAVRRRGPARLSPGQWVERSRLERIARAHPQQV